MRAGRIIAVIVGALLTVIGFGGVVTGGAMLVIHATQRDSAGYYTTPTQRLTTPTAALTTRFELSTDSQWVADRMGTLRVRATAVDGRALFVGVAPADRAEAWLAGTPYERVDAGTAWHWRMHARNMMGGRYPPMTPPGSQEFWAASASGPGTQVLTWQARPGDWVVLVANADGTPGVAADVQAGARTDLLLPIGLAAGGVGLVLLAGGVLLMILAVRRPTPAGAPVAAVSRAPGTYPARLDGHLDAPLSRWLWLVKWLLVIPHAIVLVLLWFAVVPLTAVAGVVILFTGRYPRSIFDFNVGVMRWTWRVTFYAFSAFGTDRYPPFSLHPDPGYPADFSVDYPERLSRGLVLVKWWLLAIPQYLVVALFAGGWSSWSGRDSGPVVLLSAGLIGLLAFVAVVVLLFTGRYPVALFDFIMGMNRWCFRVMAYAGLLRDEYPPFRMDLGGTDPGSVPVPPPPPPPEDRGALASAAAGLPGA